MKKWYFSMMVALITVCVLLTPAFVCAENTNEQTGRIRLDDVNWSQWYTLRLDTDSWIVKTYRSAYEGGYLTGAELFWRADSVWFLGLAVENENNIWDKDNYTTFGPLFKYEYNLLHRATLKAMFHNDQSESVEAAYEYDEWMTPKCLHNRLMVVYKYFSDNDIRNGSSQIFRGVYSPSIAIAPRFGIYFGPEFGYHRQISEESNYWKQVLWARATLRYETFTDKNSKFYASIGYGQMWLDSDADWRDSEYEMTQPTIAISAGWEISWRDMKGVFGRREKQEKRNGDVPNFATSF